MKEQQFIDFFPKIILKPADLARSWLGYEGAKLIREFNTAKSVLDSDQDYKPTRTDNISSSYENITSMDQYDWKSSQLEDENWRQNINSELRKDKKNIKTIKENINKNTKELEQVLEGNTFLITKYANLEIERRAQIIEKTK